MVAVGRSEEALDLSYGRIDAQLGVLLAAGFSPEQAGYAYHLLSTYTRGCLISERQLLQAGGHESRTPETGAAGLPLPGGFARYPSLSRVVSRNWSYSFATDADFRAGLEVVIAGLGVWLSASSGKEESP